MQAIAESCGFRKCWAAYCKQVFENGSIAHIDIGSRAKRQRHFDSSTGPCVASQGLSESHGYLHDIEDFERRGEPFSSIREVVYDIL
jgi:hypothetical protein